MPTADGLYYELHGPLDAPPLLLSSGLGGSASYWAPNLAALSERYRVLVYDHRGTGRSDRALPDTITVADLAADILALLDALGIVSTSLIGHAAGGVAGLALALTAPERLDKLVVVNSWATPDPHFVRCFDTRLALLRDSGVRAYVRAQPLFLYPADWSSANSARLDDEENTHVAGFPTVAAMEARIAALRAFDVADRLGEIATPTLVLSSADDMLVPATAGERLAAGLPNARFHKAAWGGHAVNITASETFDAVVLDFLGS